MTLLPLTRLFQTPSINNITIEDEIITFVLFEKVGDFFGLGTLRAKVNIRYNDSLEVLFQTFLV